MTYSEQAKQLQARRLREKQERAVVVGTFEGRPWTAGDVDDFEDMALHRLRVALARKHFDTADSVCAQAIDTFSAFESCAERHVMWRKRRESVRVRRWVSL